jgi:hypothetical protein
MRKVLCLICLSALIACSSGNTSGGELDGDDGSYVGDNAGSVSLDLVSDRIPVGGTSGFVFSAKDSDGGPVPNIQVACDSEEGIAILEPTTGFEMTNSDGVISGQIGCEAPGSYQFGCRLPVGTGLREFKNVVCTGSAPEGFTGFPGAAGGGLGSGGSVVDDPSNRIRITGIVVESIVSPTDTKVDTVRTSCSSNLEKWANDNLVISVTNGTRYPVRFTSASYTSAASSSSGSSVTSGNLAGICEIAAGQTGTCKVPFTRIRGLAAGATKEFAGTSVEIKVSGSRNVTVKLKGVWRNSDLTISGATSVAYGNYDNC